MLRLAKRSSKLRSRQGTLLLLQAELRQTESISPRISYSDADFHNSQVQGFDFCFVSFIISTSTRLFTFSQWVIVLDFT